MAATVSAWAKPGAWALEAEEHDAMEILQRQQQEEIAAASAVAEPPSSDFPSLAAAAATKASKKKKKLSLAEFTTGQAVTHGFGAKFRPSAGLSTDEVLVLPTGPRERTAEELEQSSYRGFNYSSYGGGGRRGSGEESGGGSRWGSSRGSEERESRRNNYGEGGKDLAPSRADEIDDWGAGKKSAAPLMERRERSGGFFDSQSRADESDSWISNKSSLPPSEGRRMNDGYRERRGGFDFNREGQNGTGGPGPDADTWGKKREDVSGGGRPRLLLQPRSLHLENGNGNQGVEQEGNVAKSKGSNPFGAARPREEVLAEKGQDWKKIDEKVESVNGDHHEEQPVVVAKSRGSNPFGAARPREEVLAEKGQDWKQIDEKLESMRIREARPVSRDEPGFRRRSPAMGNEPEGRTEKSWRKAADSAEAPAPPSSEKAEEEDASDI